ncbi:hypothetical protein ABZS66_36935 [Dactylosporangium sp. NPDC005572]|uniref:hypothetical protein n=1 Tax=Dactylosporangium sp. NPDC005572 TaxID=3156889 RepID=UPI0033BB3F15
MRITFPRVLRSEWTKLVSLRSTWWTLAPLAVLVVALAGVIGNGIHRSGGELTHASAVSAAFLPVDFAVLVLGVFGVLQMTGEYGTGSIRSTLTAVPRRWPVVAAKALVQASLTLPVSVLTCAAAYVACQAFLGEPFALRPVLGAAGSLVLMGLLGLAVGALLRHTAAAVTTLVAGLFVVPALLGPALPGNREEDVLRWVPAVAGQAMYSVDGTGAPFKMFSPLTSTLVLTAWAVLLLAGGALVLHRRDA